MTLDVETPRIANATRLRIFRSGGGMDRAMILRNELAPDEIDIVITPEMTRAGVEEFLAHLGLSDPADEAVAAIFTAMILASSERASPDQSDRP